jgi:hypothetical protein
MQKRRFLHATMVGAMTGIGATAASAGTKSSSKGGARGPTLLTVSGLIGAGNRGPLDPATDQLMVKQNLAFTRAQTFDFAAITALPATTLKMTLPYDSKPHALTGPLLTDAMKACGVNVASKVVFFCRAIDGYAAQIPVSQARDQRFIIATHLDGQPMALGGVGPLWTIFDVDHIPEVMAKPMNDRFGQCPWATYYVEVKEG